MAEKRAILTKNAPPPLPGIYSQAIVANGFVYCSGCVPMDAQTGKIVDGDIALHTEQCIKNVAHILEAAGSHIDKVVKVNVFLSNMDDFSTMNSVYTLYWGDVKPARTCVAVKTLPLNSDVEIECVAIL
ncbi:RutC family protein PH0854 [Penicillium brasilianum]|uniref:RutC family protein PH0854 n=1 Tax=Penicillium brasilianum TaxID=104259 RepID=A0A1S9RD46_PENBI|nr:RutC family protein PH0854 [Penicillium brasilianum]